MILLFRPNRLLSNSRYFVQSYSKHAAIKPISRIQKLSSLCIKPIGDSHRTSATSRKLALLGSIAGGVLIGVYGLYQDDLNADASPTELIAEADRLYDLNRFQDIYDLLLSHKNIKDDEILWRLARATYEKAKAAKTDEEKKVLYREALDYAEEALSINENNFAVHKWMSILIDYVYGYEGTKARISQSFNVKHHMERACELNPTDATSRYLLGYWCFTVANIPWYQRKIAAVIFATPPSSSFEEALSHFLQAEKLSPNFYSKNLFMIGKTYKMLGKTEEAKHYLVQARDYPQKTREDRESREDANELLKTLG